MPPDQKAFQIWSIWFLMAPVIMSGSFGSVRLKLSRIFQLLACSDYRDCELPVPLAVMRGASGGPNQKTQGGAASFRVPPSPRFWPPRSEHQNSATKGKLEKSAFNCPTVEAPAAALSYSPILCTL